MKNKSGSKSIMDSVEILRVIKKIKTTAQTGGGFTPSLSHPRQDTLFQGSIGVFKEKFQRF